MRYAMAQKVVLDLCRHLGLDANRVTALDIELRPDQVVRVVVTMLPTEEGVEASIAALVAQPEHVVEINDG